MPAIKQPCGTRAAYRRHRAKGEDPCAPCKAAYAAWARRHEDTRTKRHPCPGCGRSIRTRLCLSCLEMVKLGLFGGEWVVRRGIKVWVPWSDVEDVA